jgi:hypothetical protein
MELTQKLDDYGKAAWIMMMILGFVVFWPIGLVILAFMIGSGRMGCWKFRGLGRWHYGRADEGGSGSRRRRHRRCGPKSTGNSAFDEYRAETLRRLEEERGEFEEFLESLRHAKDKAEFDQFMADQRNRGPKDAEGPEPHPAA